MEQAATLSWPLTGRRRSDFVAVRLDETENLKTSVFERDSGGAKFLINATPGPQWRITGLLLYSNSE
jgi:hypothetical protein